MTDSLLINENQNTVPNDMALGQPDLMNPHHFLNEALGQNQDSPVSQALEDPQFGQKYYAALSAAAPKKTTSKDTGKIAKTLNQLGLEDQASIHFFASADMAGKSVSLKAGCDVKKVENGFAVSINGTLAGKFVQEWSSSLPIGDLSASVAAGLTGKGSVTVLFPNAQEAEKAFQLLGKTAITTGVIVPATLCMPGLGYVIATKGSTIPVVGKYLVDVNHIPDIKGKITNVTSEGGVTLDATAGAEFNMPFSGLQFLLKANGSAAGQMKFTTGAELDFSNENHVDMILKAQGSANLNLQHKEGIGKYNSLYSGKNTINHCVNLSVEEHLPLSREQLKQLGSQPLNAVKNISQEVWDKKKTLVRLNYVSDDYLSGQGQDQELVIEAEDMTKLADLNFIKQAGSLDFESMQKFLEQNQIKYQTKNTQYTVCGKTDQGQIGLSKLARLKAGYENGFRDVGCDDKLCE